MKICRVPKRLTVNSAGVFSGLFNSSVRGSAVCLNPVRIGLTAFVILFCGFAFFCSSLLFGEEIRLFGMEPASIPDSFPEESRGLVRSLAPFSAIPGAFRTLNRICRTSELSPGEVNSRYHFEGWGWEKAADSPSTALNKSEAFNRASDVADPADITFSVDNEELALLTQMYFERVIIRAKHRKSPEFPKAAVFHIPTGDVAAIQRIIKKRNSEPLHFAEHMRRSDRLEWLKRLCGRAKKMYEVTSVTGLNRKIHCTIAERLNNRELQTGCLSFAFGRVNQTVIFDRVERSRFRMINENGEQFDPSGLTKEQKTADTKDEEYYFHRPGYTVSFVEVDPRFRNTGKTADLTNYELFQFDGGGNYSFNREYRHDFETAVERKLLPSGHQVASVMEVSAYSRKDRRQM